MGIFDKIKDALEGKDGNAAQDSSADAAQTRSDVPVDPTLDQTEATSADVTPTLNPDAAQDVEAVPGPADVDATATTDSALGAALGAAAAGNDESPTGDFAPAQHTETPATAVAPEPVSDDAASAPAAAAQSPAAAEPETYTVADGDNLTWIGERLGVSVDDLVRANGIENPDLIFPGQVLTIPR